MRIAELTPARGEGRNGRLTLAWIGLGYVLLYAFGYLTKPYNTAAAIWPAHALSFAAFVLTPARGWGLVALGMMSLDLLSLPVLDLIAKQASVGWVGALGFACANVLTSAGPAALVRVMRLFRGRDRWQLVISPLWIVAMFCGVLPGALLGAAVRAYLAGTSLPPEDIVLWSLAGVLTTLTLGPTIFGLLLGFAEPSRARGWGWERWAISGILAALFAWLALAPWPIVDQPMKPMLLTFPLIWSALRCSRRATSILVAVVALGIVFLAGRALGSYPHIVELQSWRMRVISIDIFLLIGCGGALLINLMTLRQRALLEELAREHEQLLQYAQDLDLAEENARRSTAADLHDGVGQILAGQSMTLSAMRAHASNPLLSALVEESLAASREAQQGVRVMIQNLSPPELEYATLEQTLKWLVELFRTRHGFQVTYRIDGSGGPRREQIRLIYRCIRELLMNACKHSQRKSAGVEVEVSEDFTKITVMDDGVGFDITRPVTLSRHRFGLDQLRARVHTVGGELAIEAAVGKGTRVVVRLPALAT